MKTYFRVPKLNSATPYSGTNLYGLYWLLDNFRGKVLSAEYRATYDGGQQMVRYTDNEGNGHAIIIPASWIVPTPASEPKQVPINRSDVLRVIALSSGRIFGVTFIKRTNGERRTLNCKLSDRFRSFSLHNLQHNQVLVVENNLTREKGELAYRTIPLEGVESVRYGNTVYIVK